ncbi:hypothetical protein ALC56_06418, partial [Trachymyrmex septentrionalis]
LMSVIAACGISIYLFLPIWPRIFDVILAINDSRSRSAIYIATEYFVDQENFSYLILLHTNAASCIGTTAMVATGTMLIAYLKHICGMFSIARFSQIFIKSFERSFFCLIAAGMVCLTSALVQIISYNSTEQLVLQLSRISVLYMYMFLSNYIAQDITDHNEYVFATVYNVEWYVAPIHIQKMMLFLLQKGTKAFHLILGGIFIASMESAATIISYNSTEQLVLQLIYISVLYMYMFLSNYTAQDITDHNEYVFATVYNVEWYVAPLHIQKMMLFLLQKGTKAFHLILGGIFIASMESAATVRDVKCLMERLQQICNELKDENELNIMKEYGNNVKRYTTIFLLFAMSCIFIGILTQILWIIFDIVLQTNESHSRQMLHIMVSESFIDEEKYYYIILLYTNVVICIGTITITAIGTMLRGYLIHACGMFKIASYRIEQAMTINNLQKKEKEIMIYKQIIYAVNVHRKAMELCKSLISCFEGLFFSLIAVGVLICTVIIIASKKKYILYFSSYPFIIWSFVHRYNVRWYIAPLHIQKMILFLLQIGNKAFGLHIGGLFVASLNCFASVRNVLLIIRYIKYIMCEMCKKTIMNIMHTIHIIKQNVIHITASKCIDILLHCSIFHTTMM